MRQEYTSFRIHTSDRGLQEFTRELQKWLAGTVIETGLVTLFCRHTSASLTVQENADPDVVRDLDDFFCALAPEDPARYRHANEGLDDMPAHIKSALTDVSLSIPVAGGRAVLGTWQGVYLYEHRTRDHTREIVAHVIGA